MTEAAASDEAVGEEAQPNNHLSEDAYLSDEQVGRLVRSQIRAELLESMEEQHSEGKRSPRLKVLFFYDADTESYGVETLLSNRPLEIVEGDTLIDAINEMIDPSEESD